MTLAAASHATEAASGESCGVGEVATVATLARATAASAEVDPAAAHAGIAQSLVLRALQWLGAAETPRGPERRYGLVVVSAMSDRAIAKIDRRNPGKVEAALSQRFLAGAERPELLLVIAPAKTQDFAVLIAAEDIRVRVVEDEPTFGMAVARRGWIELEGRFADGELLPLPPAGLASTAVRLRSLEELLHLSVDHGGLRGFFAKAKSYVSTQSRPWDSTGLARATDDPHIVRQWGHFTAQIDALTILYDEAVAETDATLDRGAAEPGPALTVARSYASSLAGPLISGVIEILGASATSDRHGFDRFWRDLTAHALDDPPLHNLEDIGRARIARRRPAVNKDRG